MMMRTRTPAELFGFVAYLFVVGGGLPDRELLTSALRPAPADDPSEPGMPDADLVAELSETGVSSGAGFPR